MQIEAGADNIFHFSFFIFLSSGEFSLNRGPSIVKKIHEQSRNEKWKMFSAPCLLPSALRQSLDIDEETERAILLYAQQEVDIDRCARRQWRDKRDRSC